MNSQTLKSSTVSCTPSMSTSDAMSISARRARVTFCVGNIHPQMSSPGSPSPPNSLPVKMATSSSTAGTNQQMRWLQRSVLMLTSSERSRNALWNAWAIAAVQSHVDHVDHHSSIPSAAQIGGRGRAAPLLLYRPMALDSRFAIER